MKVVKKPLSELHSPERNVRLHTDKQLKEFRRSVEMFGQIRPIVVDESGMILAGNGLLEAMRSMGRTEADCYVVTGLTEAQKKKLMLADNRVFNLGVDDMEALLAGAKFQWWCIEVKHFNCLNQLSNDESFICWDSRKAAQWVRQPPPFALRNHPKLRPRVDSYQTFLPRVTMDGIMLSGVRASESVQRLQLHLLTCSWKTRAGTTLQSSTAG